MLDNSHALPIFSSHYSYDQGGILTLSAAGSSKVGNPISIFDIAKEYDLKEVVLVESKMDGFVEAIKNAEKAKVNKLVLGIKLVVCNSLADESEASRKTESSVIIFVRNYQGYKDLIKIYNKAWTVNNKFGYGRTDWAQLNALFTDNLHLAFPFFSSFVARNILQGHQCLPIFQTNATPPIFLNELGSDMPFAPIIEEGILQFISECKQGEVFLPQIVTTKSVYYKMRADFAKYQIYRCILNRSEFSKPEVEHLCSDSFCWESYQNLPIMKGVL